MPDKTAWQRIRKFGRQVVLPKIANLKFAIGLLLVIAALSSLGTFINQDEPAAFYLENYPESPALYGFITGRLILDLGIDHLYRTPWFLTLLGVFATSLTSCTFYRQLPELKFARRWKFLSRAEQFIPLPYRTDVTAGDLDLAAQLLKKRGYSVFEEDNKMYATKGIIGKVGPILVHASMLCILAGSVTGALFGWMAQEMVPSGREFSIHNVVSAGPFSEGLVPRELRVRVNRFWIDYNNDGSISQFYSDLSVLDNQGTDVHRETISVNHPLRHDGMMFYQTNWAIAGLKLRVNDSPEILLPMGKMPTTNGTDIWATIVPTQVDLKKGISLLAKDFNNIIVYDTDGQLVEVVRPGMISEPMEGVRLYLDDLLGATGLQIKKDPGIPIVYTGFGFMMLSTMMSYISHFQVWVLRDKDGRLYIGGKTNRAVIDLENDMYALTYTLEDDAQDRIDRARGLRPASE